MATFLKESISLGLTYSSAVEVVIIMEGSMTAHSTQADNDAKERAQGSTSWQAAGKESKPPGLA